MKYYAVTIEKLSNKKKYEVIVETDGEPYQSKLYQSLEKRVMILRAIEKIAHKLTKSEKRAYINAARTIYEKSRGYDGFVNNLKMDLNIKVKAKKI